MAQLRFCKKVIARAQLQGLRESLSADAWLRGMSSLMQCEAGVDGRPIDMEQAKRIRQPSEMQEQ